MIKFLKTTIDFEDDENPSKKAVMHFRDKNLSKNDCNEIEAEIKNFNSSVIVFKTDKENTEIECNTDEVIIQLSFIILDTIDLHNSIEYLKNEFIAYYNQITS